MAHEDQTTDPGLPADLAARLHRLAETETTGSRPFPRVDTALRRDRFTRYGTIAVATAVAAAVLAIEMLGGVGLNQAEQGVPAAPTATSTTTSSPTPSATTPQEAGYGQTAGSLAEDTDWLADIADVAVKYARRSEPDAEPQVDDLQVVATGDIADRARYAVVLVPVRTTENLTVWERETWLGKAGSKASAMTMIDGSGFSDDDVLPTYPSALFYSWVPDDPSQAFVILVAPGAQDVEITSGRRFLPDGTTQDETRALTATGSAVWVSALTADEYQIAEYSADGQGVDEGTNAPSPDLSSVATSGTDTDQLEGLANSWYQCPGMGTDMDPVFAAAHAITGTETDLSGGILRSPDNGYLVGLAAVHHNGANSTTSWQACVQTDQNYADDSEIMVAAVSSGYSGKALGRGHRLLVLAPEGAVQVRAEGVTADVDDRLATIDVPVSKKKAPTVQALDADGRVIATVTAVTADGPLLMTG